MKLKFLGLFIAFLFSIACQASDDQDYRNFYGISWRGKAHDNLEYARQMKYDAVFYIKDMELDSLSDGLGFYLESPEYFIYNRIINRKQQYSTKEIDFYNQYCAIKDMNAPFPENLATGWVFNSSTFSAQLDFQQKKVVNWAIDAILAYVKQIQDRNPRFAFAGYAWDVPQPGGDFWSGVPQGRLGSQVTLSYWAGKDSDKKKQRSATSDYNSYSEGRLEFYRELFRRTRELYPKSRFVMEPYDIYNDWVRYTEKAPNANGAMPDLLCQEKDGLEFATDKRLYASGQLKAENIGSTTPSVFGEKENRELAATAAIQGSWFSWFGRFGGGSGNMPDFQSISEVPARLKLIRAMPNWENINKTAIISRKWDGVTYRSPTAFASASFIAARQPQTGKIFFVVLTPEAHIPVGSSKFRIYRTDSFFRETKAVENDFVYKDGYLTLKNANELGKGYILTQGEIRF